MKFSFPLQRISIGIETNPTTFKLPFHTLSGIVWVSRAQPSDYAVSDNNATYEHNTLISISACEHERPT